MPLLSRVCVCGGRRLVLLFVALAALMIPGLVSREPASAEPAAITQARQEAKALWARIDQLNEELGAVVEDYNYAMTALSQTRAASQTTKLRLSQAESDLSLAKGHLAERLVEMYKEGQLGLLDTLMDAASFSEVVSRLDYWERMSGQDARLVTEIQVYRDEQTAIRAELAQQLEEEQVLAAEAEAAMAVVEEKLAANEAELADKKDQIAVLIKEEEERQRRLAEAARRAAEEAARLPNRIVATAMKYLGCPYVWGAAGPSSFDCSGLAQYVYKQYGISLPHSSAMQARLGTPVARTALQPGDLIFFYNPIHHVAIYVGGGKMIHAAGTGRGVRIDYVSSHRSYNCARRVIP